MKKKSTSKSAFFNLRVLIASVFCLFGVFVALLGSGAFAQPRPRASQQPARSSAHAGCSWYTDSGSHSNGRSGHSETGLAKASLCRAEGRVRRASAHAISARDRADRSAIRITAFRASRTSSSCSKIFGGRRPQCRPPLLTFEGVLQPSSAVARRQTAMVMSVRIITSKRSMSAFAVYDKTGNLLAGPITYNSFFAPFDGHSLPVTPKRR